MRHENFPMAYKHEIQVYSQVLALVCLDIFKMMDETDLFSLHGRHKNALLGPCSLSRVHVIGGRQHHWSTQAAAALV